MKAVRDMITPQPQLNPICPSHVAQFEEPLGIEEIAALELRDWHNLSPHDIDRMIATVRAFYRFLEMCEVLEPTGGAK